MRGAAGGGGSIAVQLAKRTSATVVAELADLIAHGELEVPIAGVFPLIDVQDANAQLEKRHTHGKLVLRP